MHIGLFSHHNYLSNTVVSENHHIIFHALVALKLFISLISYLVACSVRIVGDRQTDRTTTVSLAVHARRELINTNMNNDINTIM